MLNKVLTIVLCTLCFFSCKKEEERETKKYDKIDYEMTSALSDEPVDLDADGLKQNDLLLELPMLKDSKLTCIFSLDPSVESSYSLFWQEPHLISDGSIMYANQGVGVYFHMDDKQLIPDGYTSEMDSNDSLKYPIPTKMNLLDDSRIKVIITKRVFSEGQFKNIDVTILYKKIEVY